MIQLTDEQIRWYRLRRSGLVEPFDKVETAVFRHYATATKQHQIHPADYA